MVWLNVFIVPSSKLFDVTIPNEQNRYQWSCWACIKEDLNASCAEIVFGKTIVLPGEFFEPSSQTRTDPSEFLLRLRETFRTLKQLLLPVIHLPHVSCTQSSKPALMSLLG
ncbi:hypothetical protein TNCT_396731 [Trichonephila clavata]|uniref:Uncharacterized protein n=1 Tax=Trichonephila clavata TaxID=2740835 RepID=A0A8X6I1P6_TRICU|nr:hypothetical protein TNCT_396731 [Trichonephila clavata]